MSNKEIQLQNTIRCVTQLYRQYSNFLSGEPSYPEIEQEMGRYIFQQISEIQPDLRHPAEIKESLQVKIQDMAWRLITHNNRLIVKKIDDLWLTLVQDTLFNLILKHLGIHVLYEEGEDVDNDNDSDSDNEPLQPLDVSDEYSDSE